MWLQATITADDFARALVQVTPTRVALDKEDEDRYLWLDRPSHVSLVEGRGLCVITAGRLQWDVIGIRVPVTMPRMKLLLSPMIAELDGSEVLAFTVRIEGADISSVPGFVEDALLARVNDALARPGSRLVWRFLDTLDSEFNLPDRMLPRRRMHLFARRGSVRVDAAAVRLAVSWGLTAQEVSAQPAEAVAATAAAPATAPAEQPAARASAPTAPGE